MATESNTITAPTKVRIPLKHCFEIKDPPGTETLFVVLSQEPRDSFVLYDKIKSPPNPQRPAPRRTAASVENADASIADGTVSAMRARVWHARHRHQKDHASRRRQPNQAESVYVVNSSSNPASNLAAQIEVHHR